ncbi:hypothetical protein COOONC_02788 [Cooperia oncophora]
MQAHGVHFNEETQRLINQRETLKAAMFETMLKRPKFIPKTWVQQYDEFHKEALRATTGINWAKIILFYPRQRAFDDGEADLGTSREDIAAIGLLVVFLGPNDSKSFEETEREKQAQCLFMDTALMEHATAMKRRGSDYSVLQSVQDTTESSIKEELRHAARTPF